MFFYKEAKYHLQHANHIHLTLDLATVSTRLKKCELFTHKVRYIGYNIETGRLSIDEVVVKAIKESEKSRTKQKLRYFFGFYNFY